MVRDFSQKTVQELYETIRVNVDEEEQWKVFDFVEDFFMEELEIGDYINDINSYHLHMFDKHDVTTKKFDAIVEKAGKVDANYAAQIEGYCSLLGEYGKKFEAVCAMLQPEKLRLSPDKYREKLEGINTGYQNAKDIHEQEQSAYEAELYEIETVWYKKMLDKAEDYLIRSAECVVLGNFTDEVTVLGVGVQIVLGIFDLDLPCDIRDIIADVRNLAQADEIKWDMIAMLALDLIGVIPVIGALKYSDEIGTLFKNADKVSVVARSTDGAGVLAKHADEAGAWLHGVKVFRYSDETAEAVASGEKLLKESGTIYESFADMMSPEDTKRYLDFLENGSREGLTSAELAGVEKADALLVSQKVEYEDVWDLRNPCDVLEGGLSTQGYSNFADGMLPEDATRYILNNEKAFFNEFSERASAVGLSDTQIAEAFEAMKNGDYAKMATYFDTSSPVDGAVFWSGNKEGAAAYANSIGGTIMEQTPGGQVFDNWRGLGGMYPEWDTPTNLAQKPIWDALSSQYANGAEGIATYAHPDGYVGKVWSNIEKPILEENDIIIQEVIIDAK